jgi:kinesin family protein 13
VGYRYLWDLDKFSNRYYIIKDMIEKYYETGEIPELPQN